MGLDSGKIFHSLFRSETDHTMIQLFRYGIVGGLAFLVDYFVLIGLTKFAGIHYLVSAAISFVLGLAVNYLLSIRWVFQAGESLRSELTIYAITGITGLGLNELVLWFFTDLFHIHYAISKLFATAAIFFWNFFSRKALLQYREKFS